MNLLIELIAIGLINCLVIIGFHLAVQFQYAESAGGDWRLQREFCAVRSETKNVLWFVKWYGDQILSPFWRKPLYDCPRCMASLHSIYVYFPLVTFENSLYIYPVYILFLSGLIEIITRRFEI